VRRHPCTYETLQSRSLISVDNKRVGTIFFILGVLYQRISVSGSNACLIYGITIFGLASELWNTNYKLHYILFRLFSWTHFIEIFLFKTLNLLPPNIFFRNVPVKLQNPTVYIFLDINWTYTYINGV
jgi:hypothetical protein